MFVTNWEPVAVNLHPMELVKLIAMFENVVTTPVADGVVATVHGSTGVSVQPPRLVLLQPLNAAPVTEPAPSGVSVASNVDPEQESAMPLTMYEGGPDVAVTGPAGEIVSADAGAAPTAPTTAARMPMTTRTAVCLKVFSLWVGGHA